MMVARSVHCWRVRAGIARELDPVPTLGGTMRSNLVHMLVPLAFVAAACGGGPADRGELPDDLKQDLAATASTKLELANASSGYQPMRFVSDLEQTNSSAPVERAPAPRPVRVPKASVAPAPAEEQAPEPEPSPEVQVAEVPQAPEPQPEVSSVPMVAPRPAALPVDVPSTQVADRGDRSGRGGIGGEGVGIGGVIGVVIRGGGVGPDHCPPRRRGGRRPPFGVGFPR
jgi:hypothetical protein